MAVLPGETPTSDDPPDATSDGRGHGRLRIYLGAAPGVGKTFAMLNEGRRRADRGTDVVVGFVETHGRARTTDQVAGLEVVPRQSLSYRDGGFEEMDVDAVLVRRPELALVDELAHTNVPGGRNPKRWQDVRELLDAGIDVISTVNIQHLESVNDVVERITGIVQRETVPDEVVRAADQVELVDMTPEALRRRMAHGNVYAPEKVDAALSNYFRPGNLTALRELALLWVADRVDSSLAEYRQRHGITEAWETRERVVVAVTGAPGTEHLLRRAARIAQRTHGELLGVHVRSDEGLLGPASDGVADHHRLVEELGGRYLEVAGTDVAAALVDVARAENATQLVLGASRRNRLAAMSRGSVINRVVRLSGPIDVHVISDHTSDPETARTGGRPRRRRRPAALPPRRQQLGWATAVVGLALLTVGLHDRPDQVGLPSVLLLYLVVVVATATIGGAAPAVAAAFGAFLLANWFFTPPEFTWSVASPDNVVALVVFLVVAGVVSWFVDVAARRTTQAAQATAEARTLARLAGSLVETDPLPALVAHLRSTFELDGVALLRNDGSGWRTEVSDGPLPPGVPTDADLAHHLDHDLVLAINGPTLAAEDRRLLNIFATQLGVALERRALTAQAARSHALTEIDALRSALLQAVSHDLRTPLAGIKASASSLRQADIHWTPDQVQEFLATIEHETDRLTALVTNLLDMSRIQVGALAVSIQSFGLEEVVPGAVAAIEAVDDGRCPVEVDLPETLPEVRADPVLLERIVVNLVDNAVAHSPPGVAVRVTAGAVLDRVDLRIVDQGPGVTADDRERIFQPFHRTGDSPRSAGAGVGLGLAVARGFARAIGGELSIEDTPGGGTTMVVELQAAS
jgi:two-component system sensor histidine kinase KdpD